MNSSMFPRILFSGSKYAFRIRASPSAIYHCCRASHSRRSDFDFTPQTPPSSNSNDDFGNFVNDPPMEIDMPMVDVHPIAEPTLSSLGLCADTPAGLIQRGMEFLHVTADLPWWGVIATSAVIARICLFPLVIRQRKAMAEYINCLSEATTVTNELIKANKEKDLEKVLRLAKERDTMYQNIPMRAILTSSFVQGGVLISMLYGLRSMATLPVESMKTGGLSWFLDLTVADPLYLLPFFCSATYLIMIETGAETGAEMPRGIRTMFRLLAPALFIFTMKFQSAVVFYFCVNNSLTLIQAKVFRYTNLSQLCGIPKTVAPKMEMDKQAFHEGLMEAMKTAKIVKDNEHRQRLKDLADKRDQAKEKE